MNKPIASVARTREILKTYDLRARKGYGQNFLVDVSVVARCAQAAHAEQAVIEIGPGIGALTEQLKAKKAELKQLTREKAKAEKAAAKKKAAEEKAKLLKAVESSGKTVDEILAMIQPAKEDKE